MARVAPALAAGSAPLDPPTRGVPGERGGVREGGGRAGARLAAAGRRRPGRRSSSTRTATTWRRSSNVPILGYVEPLPGIPPTAAHLRTSSARSEGHEGRHPLQHLPAGRRARVPGARTSAGRRSSCRSRSAWTPTGRLPRPHRPLGGGRRERQVMSRLSPPRRRRRSSPGYTDPVVGPVSFPLAPGEIVGLAGPNGSGKSTLLGAIIGTRAHLLGQRAPARGHPGGRPGRSGPSRLRGDADHGREFLRLTGADRQPPPAAAGPLLDQRLDRLSGGQFQLLHVWACLGSPPNWCCSTSPTNNMDPRAARRSSRCCSRRARRAAGVLVVSHEHDLLERSARGSWRWRRELPRRCWTRCSCCRSSTGCCWPCCCRWWARYVRLREEWLASLGLAQVAAAGVVVGADSRGADGARGPRRRGAGRAPARRCSGQGQRGLCA